MLLNLREYHRPADEGTTGALERALDLLSRADIHSVPLAGGDTLVGSADSSVEAVVDLQGLGLDVITIDTAAQVLRIGAMVTRADLVAEAGGQPGDLAKALLRFVARAARRWGGSIQRNRATVGGAVAVAAPNDPLIAALLACDALVVIYSRIGQRSLPLGEFLPVRGDLPAEPALIVEVMAPLPAEPTGYGLADVARTPSDAPIVLAAAALALTEGRCQVARLALGGAAPAPIRVSAAEAMLVGQVVDDQLVAAAATRAAAEVDPAGDFRGSAEYRKAMAGALAERALREAWGHIG